MIRQKNSCYQIDLYLRKATASFYGLAFFFAGTLAVLAAGIYRDWQILTHRLVGTTVCPVWLESHTLHKLAIFILLFLLLCIAYLFLRSLLKQILACRRFKQQVGQAQIACPADVSALAAQTGIRASLVFLDSSAPFAFTYGFWRPAIAFSRGLLSSLNANELGAVLLHEYQHIRHNDAVKTMFARAISAALFFLPLARSLALAYEQARELAADQGAIAELGERYYLASALLKVVQHSMEPGMGVSLAGTRDTFGLRVSQLLSPHRAVKLTVLPRYQVTVMLVLLMGLLATFLSGCI